MSNSRGKYIVIEGHDGTGKTTQASRLQSYLESYGKEVLQTQEPGGTPITDKIRNIIKDGTLDRTPITNLLLFTASRAETWHNTIEPTLKLGKWVISTRNWWSTLAFQGYGEGVALETIEAATKNYTTSDYMSPDYGFILTLESMEEMKKRIAKRGEENIPDTFETKDNDFQNRVQKGYLEVASKYDIPLIDASRSIEDVYRILCARIDVK